MLPFTQLVHDAPLLLMRSMSTLHTKIMRKLAACLESAIRVATVLVELCLVCRVTALSAELFG
jgi:hypothetical protein